MSKEENIRIAENVFNDLNTHKINQHLDLYAEGYIYEGPGAPGPLSVDQSQALTQGFIDAFPDLHFEMTNRIADGDFVVINWVSTGTHKGPLRTPSGNAIPPTGRSGTVPGSTTYEFKNGKITHAWIYWDMAGMLAQLGLMPDM
jgi:steroid delta-isomerase-like uncharacterized protein